MSTKELLPNHIQWIVVHCSDSPPDRGDSACTINRWHLERGWDLIGYHKVILPNGEIENGRPEYVRGAHCKGYNSRSLSVCLIGEGAYTAHQYASLNKVLKEWSDKYRQPEIVGHCELDPRKTCPGFDVREYVKIERKGNAL